MVEESEYAEALVNLVHAAVEMFTENYHVRYVLQHLTAAYISLLRVLRRPPEDWQAAT